MEFNIGGDRYIIARKFNGTTYVHIRQYETGNGNWYPRKIGISFTEPQFDAFVSNLDHIDRARKRVKEGKRVARDGSHQQAGSLR